MKTSQLLQTMAAYMLIDPHKSHLIRLFRQKREEEKDQENDLVTCLT